MNLIKKVLAGILTSITIFLFSNGAEAAGGDEAAAAAYSANNGRMDKVRLEWEVVPKAVRYNFYILKDPMDNYGSITDIIRNIYTNGYELDTSSMGTDKWGYYWKVRAFDLDGNIIKDTEVRPLIQGEINPETVKPTTEFDKMDYMPLYPVYSWVPFNGAESYDIQVYKVSNGRDVRIRELKNLTGNIFYEYGGYTHSGKYYWRILPKSSTGAAMAEWSEPSRFEITDYAPVAALGDSITHGGGSVIVPPGYKIFDWESYSSVPIKNLGFSGDTVEGMSERFEREVLPFAPKLLVIMGGVNNYREGATAWKVISGLRNLSSKCDSYGIIPVFLTVTPINPDKIAKIEGIGNPSYGWMEEQQTINQWIRRQPHYIDVASAMTDSRGWLADETTTDGLHPDLPGKRLIGEKVGEYLEENFPDIANEAKAVVEKNRTQE